MALILATVTEDARKYWPWFFGGKYGVGASTFPSGTVPPSTWNPLLYSFKMGVGGWENPGTGPIPRAPDPALRMEIGTLLQDIDALVDATRTSPGRYGDALGNRAWFEKTLSASDFTFTAPNILEIRCVLDLGDFNDTGASSGSPVVPPEIWELGIFSDHPDYARVAPATGVNSPRLMVAYATFPKEIKYPTNQIEHIVKISF
jgi:hypothetical protein